MLKKVFQTTICFPITVFNVSIKYFTKRKPTAFEDIILKAINEQKNIPEMNNLSLNDFLQNYLMIPNAEAFILPTISNLVDMALIQYNEDIEYEELRINDFSITADAIIMLKKGYIPTDDKERTAKIYWNSVTKELFTTPNKASISETCNIKFNETEIDNLYYFPQQLAFDNAYKFIEKFNNKKDEVRSVEQIEVELLWTKEVVDVLVNEKGELSFKLKEEYYSLINESEFAKELLTQSLESESMQTNYVNVGSCFTDIKSFYTINQIEQISQIPKIKLFNKDILDVKPNTNELNVICNSKTNKFELDNEKFSANIFLKDKLPDSLIYIDNNGNQIKKHNFTFSFRGVNYNTNQKYGINNTELNYKLFLDKISENIESDKLLIKLFWKQKQEVWNEFFYYINSSYNNKNSLTISKLNSIIFEVKDFVKRINHFDNNIESFNYKNDLKLFFGELINKCNSIDYKYTNSLILELSLLIDLDKEISDIFEKVFIKVTDKTISEIISVIKETKIVNNKYAISFLLDKIDVYLKEQNSFKVYDDILKLLNDSMISSNTDILSKKVSILKNFPNSLITNLNEVISYNKLLKKSNITSNQTESISAEKLKWFIKIYDSNFNNVNFIKIIKDDSIWGQTFKLIKENTIYLSVIFPNTKSEPQVRKAILQNDISKIYETINTFLNEYNKIEYALDEDSNITKAYSKITDIKPILYQYITNIPDECKTVLLFDTNAFINNPDILAKVSDKNTFVLFSKTVLDELDKKKPDNKIGRNVSLAIKNIKKYTETKKNFSVEEANTNLLPNDYDISNNDNKILSVALKYKSKNPVIITDDNNLKNKAFGESIKTKSFNNL